MFSIENTYDNHSMATSRDLGIGLSTDFKVDNEIQKPGHKQVSNIFVILRWYGIPVDINGDKGIK